MLKNKHKITLIVIAVIIALVLLFIVGKEIAAGFAAVLGIFGFSGGRALKEKSDEVKKKAEQEKEVVNEVENNIDDRNKKDKQLQQDDQKRSEIAEELENESGDREKEMQKIRDNQVARKEKGKKLNDRLKELKGDD